MTNEQLYILLTSYQNRLSDELNKIRQLLPDNIKRHPKSDFSNLILTDGDFIILDGLKDFLNELNQARESLVPRRNVSPRITMNVNRVKDD